MKAKKALALVLSLALAAGLFSGCGPGGKPDAGGVKLTSYDKLKVGEDGAGLTATVRVATAELPLENYAAAFNAVYPNITLQFTPGSGEDPAQRAASADLVAIPGGWTVSAPQGLFHALARTDSLEGSYRFADLVSAEGTVYAIPSASFVDGILYSKSSLSGIPADTDALWDALSGSSLYISENAANTLDRFAGVPATGGGSWLNGGMLTARAPFEGDGAALYRALYAGMKQGVVELGDEDGCARVASGQSAAAVAAGRELAALSDKSGLALAPFPLSGSAAAQVAESYAVNKSSSVESKLAAMLFIKWLSEKSSLAEDLCAVPAAATAPLPAILADLEGVSLVQEAPLDSRIAQWAAAARSLPGLPMGSGAEHLRALAEAEDLDALMAQWNDTWAERYTTVRTGRDYSTLPALMTFQDGSPVTTAEEFARRRLELLELFRENVYGHAPVDGYTLSFDVVEQGEALNGAAVRRQVKLTITTPKGSSEAMMLLYLPKSSQPAPVIVGLNYQSNHQALADDAILPSSSYTGEITPESRGSSAESWSIEEAIRRGYGVATAAAGDFAPDSQTDYASRWISLFDMDDFMAVGAWAFGIMRMVDYLVTDSGVDPEAIVDVGHSRLGKAAVWAGAQDERIALVISNDSGNSGASLSRGTKGESVADANILYTHWFCDQYSTYNDRVDELPVDQHMLLACVAPRRLYVGSASEDLVTDPQNAWNALMFSRDAFRVCGLGVIEDDAVPYIEEQPAEGQRIFAEGMAYHLRAGGHAITAEDWANYFDYMGGIF